MAANRESATSTEIERLLRQLAAPQFQLRREAFFKLWNVGSEALQEVRAAKASSDPQVAASSRMLEILLRLGMEPGDQQDTSLLIGLLDDTNPVAITQLCSRGYWDAAAEILETTPELVQQFNEPAFSYQLGVIANAAWRQNDPQLAWPVIRQVVDFPLAVWIANKNNLTPPEPNPQRPIETAVSRLLLGEAEAALQQSVPVTDELPLLARSGQWQALTQEGRIANYSQALVAAPSPRTQLAIQAVLQEYAGQFDESEATWTKLLGENLPRELDEVTQPDGDSDEPDEEPESDLGPVESVSNSVYERVVASHLASLDAQSRQAVEVLEDEIVNRQLLLCLMLSGRMDAVEHYLLKSNPSHAFILFKSNSRFTEALGSLGIEADLSNFDSWLRDRQRTLVDGDVRLNYYMFDETIRLCKLLTDIGETERASQVLSVLVNSIRRGERQLDGLWGRLASWLATSEGRPVLVAELQETHASMSDEALGMVLGYLFPELEESALALWKTAPSKSGSPGSVEDFRSKWDALEHLHNLDHAFFADTPGQIANWLQAARVELRAQSISGEQLSELAQVAHGVGLSTEAIDFAVQRPVRDNTNWKTAGELLLETARPSIAANYFESYRTTAGRSRYDAMPREIDARLLAGEFQQAELLEQLQFLVPLDGKYQATTYVSVARSMRDNEEFARSAEYGEAAFLLETPGSSAHYWATREYQLALFELDQFERSADVHRAGLLEMLLPTSELGQSVLFDQRLYDYVGFVANSIQKERLSRAVSLIEAGQFERASYHLAIGGRVVPQDIESVVECVPRLTERGQNDLADAIFERYEQTMQQQIAAWPKDATALNNLAWMYSQCDRKLPEALELSRQAVELAPTSAVFLDTLAEVQYRLGNVSQAVETARACIKLDPRDSHYRSNIVRFRNGEK